MSVNSNPTGSLQNIKKLPISIFFNLSPVSLTTVVDLYFRIRISANSRKNSKWFPWYTQGRGEFDS
jgi:hypothetical protein